MKRVFAPGCALMLYKPHLAGRLHAFLRENLGDISRWDRCCRKDPGFGEPTEIINVCPGCDRRFRKDYRDSSTVSIWEILARAGSFPFPDYRGRVMSIIDACPTRDQERVQIAVRELLTKMNVSLREPENTRTKSTCCGDVFWGEMPTEQVKGQMRKRTAEMPADEVVVYCVSCSKAVFIGARLPATWSTCCSARKRCPARSSRTPGTKNSTPISMRTESLKMKGCTP